MAYTYIKSSVMDLIMKEAKNTMGKLYLSYNEAKAKIASLNLKTRREYIDYVHSNGINNLPLQAEVNYSRAGWKGFADFLGLTQEQYEANKKAQWADIVKSRKPYAKSGKYSKKPVPAPKPIVLKGLDPDQVIKFLISEDVEPATIVKMVAEMDIHSSTLMNELCKHMQERSKRQVQLWRPTGYQTAEAEFSKVG